MTSRGTAAPTIGALDLATSALVRLAAVIATGTERAIRDAMGAAHQTIDPRWVEEVILQSYLFAGFPRTLNAAREWRRVSGRPAPAVDEGTSYEHLKDWQARGERTCATVYGPFYERLRVNIRELHPALDTWMIVEGYGKVLGRSALDLRRRELCIVAVCAAAGQERQLHSHLHGALHAGASPAEVESTLDAVSDLMTAESERSVRGLWRRVRRQKEE